MIAYRGAYYVDTAAAVVDLVAHGFNLFIVPYINDIQIDAVLNAVPSNTYAVVGLNGDDTEKVRQVTRLANHGACFGFIPCDEPNLGATVSLATQKADYDAIKALAPMKTVWASYHVEPGGFPHPECVGSSKAAGAYDYPMVNFYPATYGRTDTEAGAALAAAVTAARAFFVAGTPVIPIEQAAGCSVNTPGNTRDISGNLQAQHTIWANAGMCPVGAMVFYGYRGNPEDITLSSSAALLTEAANVS